MRKRRVETLVGWAILVAAALAAPPADALPIRTYAELLTSEAFLPLADQRLVLDQPGPIDPFQPPTGGTAPGLGSWRIAPGAPKTFLHRFEPDQGVASVLSATLYVALLDDARPLPADLFEPERGVVEVAGFARLERSATNELFRLDVLPLIGGAGSSFRVTVASTLGDFALLGSALVVEYAPVPEPGPFVLVGVGLIGIALLRLRSSGHPA